MKKKWLSTLLYILTPTIAISALAPILSSCVIKNKQIELKYYEKQRTVVIPSQLINQHNIWYFYNQMLVNNLDVNTTTGFISELDTQLKTIISSIEALKDTTLNINFNDFKVVPCDITNNQFNLQFSATITTLQAKTPLTISIAFDAISFNELSNLFNNGEQIDILAPQYFPNFSLEQIQSLSPAQIMAQIPDHEIGENVVILDNQKINLTNYGLKNLEIYTDTKTNRKILKIAIFSIDSKGLGWLNIYENIDVVNDAQPSSLLQELIPNEDLTNHWPLIRKKILPNLDEITSFNYLSTNSEFNTTLSFANALKQSSITSYFDTNYKTNLASNYLNDLDFFLKDFIASLAKQWNDKNLVNDNTFVYRTIQVNDDETISSQIAIELFNNTQQTQIVKLPITNKPKADIIVEPLSRITIYINTNNATISPKLTPILNQNLQAYLTLGLNNLEIKVYNHSTNISTPDFIDTIKDSITNIFDYSYSLNCIVQNVAYGNDISTSENVLKQALTNLTTNDILVSHEQTISNNFNKFIRAFKAIENIMLNIADNPKLFDFIKSINLDVYDLIFVLTENESLSWMIADIFSNKTLSEYLHANSLKIVDVLEQMDPNKENEGIQAAKNVFYDITTMSPTLEDKKEFVQSVIGLVPIFEGLISSKDKWMLPLIEMIFSFIANEDPPVINILSKNLDYILQFLTQNGSGLNQNDINMLKDIMSFLEELITFSNKQFKNINANPEKYENIKILDLLAFVLMQEEGKTLFNLFALPINLFSKQNINLNMRSTDFIKGVYIPEIIQDFSQGEIKKTFLGKFQVKTITQTKLSQQLGKVIKTLFTVIYNDNTTAKLSDILIKYIGIEIDSNNSTTLNTNNNQVDMNYKIKFKINHDFEIDLVPLLVLLDNLELKDAPTYKEPTNPDKNGWITVTPRKHIDLKTSNLDPNIVNILKILKLDEISIAQLLPRNLIIKKDVNYVEQVYKTNNAKLTPKIDNNGLINWSLNTTLETNIIYKDVFNKSNNDSLNNKTFYGNQYDTLTKMTLTSGNLLGQNVTVLDAENTMTSNHFITVKDQKANYKIDNYNSQIFIPDSTIELKNTLDQTVVNFQTFINSYTTWEKSPTHSYLFFKINNETELTNFITNNFTFGNAFNNNEWINYSYGINAIQNEILMKLESEYKFVINFNVPILYKWKDSANNQMVELKTNQIEFSFKTKV